MVIIPITNLTTDWRLSLLTPYYCVYHQYCASTFITRKDAYMIRHHHLQMGRCRVTYYVPIILSQSLKKNFKDFNIVLGSALSLPA